MTFSIIQKSQTENVRRFDAEYFQPKYLEIEKRILSTKFFKKWGDFEGNFITGPFGSEFNVENYSDKKEHRYVRGKDVKQFFLQENDNVYIPEKDFNRLKKYSLRLGDILISVVGTLGNSSIVVDKNLPSIFSCKSTVYRTSKINQFYLIAYLNSKYGQNLLLRNSRGQVQAGLNIEDLKSLLIYSPKVDDQNKVAALIEESYNQLVFSKNFYKDSENLLLEELGLKDFKPKEDLSFVVNYSDVKKANRIDADYFQPKYAELIKNLQTKQTKLFPEIIENVPAIFNPKADENYKYVELSNINSSIGIIDGYSEVLGKEAPSRAKRMLKQGDVIVSSVEGSLGKVALVDWEQEGYLASTGFFQFKSKEIFPEVLLVLAKSFIFKMQLQKETAGTILTAVPKEAIKNILIPVLAKPIQLKIADLVKKSHEARKKSKELLEEAKRKVEEMIERR